MATPTSTVLDPVSHNSFSDEEKGPIEPPDIIRDNEVKASSPDGDIEVTLDEHENPQNFTSFKKWRIMAIICSCTTLTTCASSMAGATLPALEHRFNVSFYVSVLSISFYILGIGVGPLFLGGLSEFFGRTKIYRVSFLLAFLFSFPVAFANNIAVFLIFRFIVAFSGSAFLSVAGGSVADLFHNDKIGLPLTFYSIAPVIGPVLGPLLAGFINQHLYWRWTYHILTIWFGVSLVLIILLIPETYAPILVAQKAALIRKQTGSTRYYAPLERRNAKLSVFESVKQSFYRPFQLMYHESMILLLDIWASIVLGVIYLTFPAFPIIFGVSKGFNQQSVGMSYLGLGLGMVLSALAHPFWASHHAKAIKKHNGNPPPETRLVMAMVGSVLMPLGLFLFAFTLYSSVHWIVPIILITFFGAGSLMSFQAIITFLISTYRPYAASAIASNAFLRAVWAAAFPLATPRMLESMTQVGAMAFLGGLLALCTPLPFVFYKYGPVLRKRSKFAWSD